MQHKIQMVSSYLNALSLRERVMALVVMIAVIYAAFDILVFQKFDTEYQQLQNQQQQIIQQQQERSNSLAINSQQLVDSKRSADEIKLAITQAKQQLQNIETKLKPVFNKLVPPTKITELLRSLLEQASGLKLISLNNEPVKKITLGDENEKDVSKVQSFLYEHATIIKLSGNYQQLYQYLQALEQSKWGLFWDKLHYSVKEYPRAEITIRVHTISTDEYWIGL